MRERRIKGRQRSNDVMVLGGWHGDHGEYVEEQSPSSIAKQGHTKRQTTASYEANHFPKTR